MLNNYLLYTHLMITIPKSTLTQHHLHSPLTPTPHLTDPNTHPFLLHNQDSYHRFYS